MHVRACVHHGSRYDLNSELTYYPIGASNRVELGRNLGTQFKINVDNGNLARNVLRTQPTWNGSMSIGASGNGMQVGGQAGDLVWIASDLWALCECVATALYASLPRLLSSLPLRMYHVLFCTGVFGSQGNV